MTKLYSPATGSCYDKRVHSVIPDDAIEISDEIFGSVIGNPAPGKVRAHMPDGVPYLVDKAPPTTDELAADERVWRDAELGATEWLVMRHRDEQDMAMTTILTAAQFAELLTYRQKLRDWPTAAGFPSLYQRPRMPAWVAEQTQ